MYPSDWKPMRARASITADAHYIIQVRVDSLILTRIRGIVETARSPKLRESPSMSTINAEAVAF